MAQPSMVYRKKEPAFVWKVVHSPNYDDRELVKIVFKIFRSTEIGCKFCLTPKHEVLTPQGWLPIAEMTVDHQIAVMNEGELVYENPSEVHAFDHTGPIYKVDSPMVECETTLTHKMYAKIKKTSSFTLVEAQDLLEHDYQLKNSAVPNADKADELD